MGFLDSIRAKVELYRLEQRYTHRNKRTTFTTGARYVDGEYIFDESPGSPTGQHWVMATQHYVLEAWDCC
jgi:hypothetical protein